jgi:hypothetical protein
MSIRLATWAWWPDDLSAQQPTALAVSGDLNPQSARAGVVGLVIELGGEGACRMEAGGSRLALT